MFPGGYQRCQFPGVLKMRTGNLFWQGSEFSGKLCKPSFPVKDAGFALLKFISNSRDYPGSIFAIVKFPADFSESIDGYAYIFKGVGCCRNKPEH